MGGRERKRWERDGVEGVEIRREEIRHKEIERE